MRTQGDLRNMAREIGRDAQAQQIHFSICLVILKAGEGSLSSLKESMLVLGSWFSGQSCSKFENQSAETTQFTKRQKYVSVILGLLSLVMGSGDRRLPES